MSPRRVHVRTSTGRYDVDVGTGRLMRVGEVLRLITTPGPVLLVTDENVGPLYADPVRECLAAADFDPVVHTVPAGEDTKSLSRVSELYWALLRVRADRRTPVVALGGGVVNDLAGFAAATFLRGLPWVSMPTTLLSQVDASVGGKTGVNLPEGKNLVGAFHQPSAVLADVETLKTLPAREYRSGLAEIVKAGLALDPHLLARLEAAPERFREYGDPELSSIIYASVAAKADVVVVDEREAGPRRVLNFGHTAGHAIEAAAGYGEILHGEAVAVGMVAAVRVSVARGYLDPGREPALRKLLAELGLPSRMEELAVVPAREDVARHLHRDKKIRARRLTLVLIVEPGRTRIEEDADVEELLDALYA